MKSRPKRAARPPGEPGADAPNKNAPSSQTPDRNPPPLSPGDLESRIGHTFRNPNLLRQALTHPSRQADRPDDPAPNNQRLEFLGDSVLGLILSEELYRRYPEAREGELSRYRSALAKGPFLSGLARTLELGEYLHLSRSEIETGGRDRDNLLEDALEALLAAVYLDAGLDTARHVVLGWYENLEKHLDASDSTENPKGRLQEAIQAVHTDDGPEYRVLTQEGPSHDPRFEVEVRFRGKRLGSGKGPSKKEAEARAAEKALHRWQSPE